MSATVALSPTVPKLIRLLASDHDAEALGAARALRRVCDLNLLGDVVERSIEKPAPAYVRAESSRSFHDWRQIALWCLNQRSARNDRQDDFLRQMAWCVKRPSEKQLRWLHAIHDQLRARP